MIRSLFEALGIASWSRAEEISSRIATRLRRKGDFKWVAPGCVEKEIGSFCKDHDIRLNKSGREKLKGVLAQELSRILLRRLARVWKVEMQGLRCAAPQRFVIHDFMNPWVLIEEHAGHLRHPSKNWDFWYSRPHREWVDAIIEHDDLVPDLSGQFDRVFGDWLADGSVSKVQEMSAPLKAAVYHVRAAT